MLGIIVLMILTWLILRIVEKQNLSALGFLPPVRNLLQLSTGFIFAATVCTLLQLLDGSITHLHWTLRSNLTGLEIVSYLWWNVKSVMFEELIFRGALLYIVIRRFGVKSGILLSAICFGIYHWFSYGIFGNVVSMIIVFIMTALVGLVLAYAFAKTKSIALPIGLHLGWNFTVNAIFSKGPLGIQILNPEHGADYTPLIGIPSLLLFLVSILTFPVLSYLLIKFKYPASITYKK
ncbi:CPBP family intramembrane metalloprotease [Paenibacillus sp. LMG 31460]|uniref:CPBP family intramembrane metalloprotease n=1 Tax=Paenibacillus germinis TaxID=2654979 RepID=A0ABX1YUT5_9BACL|nr:type II CAAX endopeptidase family protein [Paenibacillus germinis]NOU84648.1 CPBP family intramembrane metalloprotease [Paenibacillus germinis]